ncbi:hypothetical protein PG988_007616 [Apiospora saccharicola]
MTPPLLKQPPHDPLPDPAKEAQWYGEIWLKYPSSQVLTPAYFGYGFKAKCDFRLIMNDFCHAAYSTGSGVAPRTLYFLRNYNSTCTTTTSSSPSTSPPRSQNDPIPLPQAVVVEATRYLQTLIRLYYLRHGFESMDLFIVIPLVNAGFHIIDDINHHQIHSPSQNPSISPEKLEVLRSTLILIAKGLHSQRSNHYLAEALFRVVRGRMRLQEASLLKTTLRFDEGEEERKSAMVQTVRSHWPVSVVKKKEDLDDHILGNLVENYAHLNTEDGPDGIAGSQEGVVGVCFQCWEG